MGSPRSPGRIIVVYNESPSLVKGEPQDMLAEQGVIACSQAVAEALVRRYEVQRVPIRADVEVALAPYPPTEWAVFNLGEGIEGRLFEEARIAWALEAMGYRTGREFNVSLWGDSPEVLPLAEIDFQGFSDPFQEIVSFAAKWDANSFAFHHTPVLCPAPAGERLAGQIREAALAAWRMIGCRGYARVDPRVDEHHQPYVIEVNCNPDLSPDAGFFQAVRRVGCSYEEMVCRIAEMTLD
jgi:hypothetical protein